MMRRERRRNLADSCCEPQHNQVVRSKKDRSIGSHAWGEATGSSDLDFVVKFRKKSFDAYMALPDVSFALHSFECAPSFYRACSEQLLSKHLLSQSHTTTFAQ
jgi:hypothetical protein